MASNPLTDDQALVEQCLACTRAAWDELYTRYLPLVRQAVAKYARLRARDWEDTVQDVFVALYNDLRNYDPKYRLSGFIWMVAQRVCVDEHRKSTASKRSGQTIPVEHHDCRSEGSIIVASDLDPPEEQVSRAQSHELLRRAFRDLGKRCSQILELRYFKGLSFKEIAELLGTDKKVLAVQAGRCIDEMRALYDRRQWEGLRR